jgi:hypothetical protein
MKQILTSKFWLLLFVLVLSGWSQPARADQPIGLIQTLCISESGVDYFSARLESFAEAARYINDGNKNAPKDKQARLKVLEKYGLIFPIEFSYTCKLEHHTYTMTGHRPLESNSECGGDPRVKLSLKRDDETVFEGAFFEPSCSSSVFHEPNAYVESFVAEDRPEYIVAVLSDGNQQRRHMLFGRGDGKILNEKSLTCLQKQGYFDPKHSEEAVKTCMNSNQK